MTHYYKGISFTLQTLKDLEDRKVASECLNTIFSGPSFVIPKRYGSVDPINLKVDKNNLDRIVELWMGNTNDSGYKKGLLVLEFCRDGDFMINWAKGEFKGLSTPKFHSVSGGIPFSRIKDTVKLEKYIDLIIGLVKIVNPVFGMIQNNLTEDWDRPFDLTIRLPEIPWGIILGEPLVELIGKEQLLTAPFHRVFELSSGHIMGQLTDSLLDPSLPENKRVLVREWLGADYFMEGKRRLTSYKKSNIPCFDTSF